MVALFFSPKISWEDMSGAVTRPPITYEMEQAKQHIYKPHMILTVQTLLTRDQWIVSDFRTCEFIDSWFPLFISMGSCDFYWGRGHHFFSSSRESSFFLSSVFFLGGGVITFFLEWKGSIRAASKKILGTSLYLYKFSEEVYTLHFFLIPLKQFFLFTLSLNV